MGTFIMKNKILVCGGTGFIGKNIIVNLLKNKKNLIYATYFKSKPFIKSKNIIWVKTDLRKLGSVKKIMKNYKFVYQCAAFTAGVKEMKENPYSFISDNLIMNNYIMQQASLSGVSHLFFFSCTVMYHHSKKKLSEKDYNPNAKIHPVYFGISKLKVYIESLCDFYSRNSKTKFTALRHSNIYGPHDKFFDSKSHFMAAMISKSILAKKNDVIDIWGDGSEKRDFLHVDDLISAINLIKIKQRKNFDVFNVCYGDQFSIKNIIDKMIKLNVIKNKVIYLKDKPTIKVDILLNSRKLNKLTGWKPKIFLDKGILSTQNWAKNN